MSTRFVLVLFSRPRSATLPHAVFALTSDGRFGEIHLTALVKHCYKANSMWWRRRKRLKSSERPPWYRAADYDGNLTEAEKRELDRVRAQPSHPALKCMPLPEHVQMYIYGLEIEAYDAKQEPPATRAIIFSLAGATLLYANHYGFTPRDSIWDYAFGIILVIVPWIVYRFEWQKNADARGSTSESIVKEWELEYIVNAKLAAERRASDPLPP